MRQSGALLGRSGQALFAADEARLQVYDDDPWSVWWGPASQRDFNRCVLLHWWVALFGDNPVTQRRTRSSW